MRLVKYREKFAAEWWEDGVRQRRSLGTDERVRAEVLFEEFKRVRAALTRKVPLKVHEAWDGYRKTLEGRPAWTTMGHEWKAIGPVFGDKFAESITEEDCLSYTALRLGKGRKPGTVWTELGRLRMSLVWAERKKLIDKAPEIVRPQQGPPRDKSLTREQAGAVIDACNLPHIRLFAVLAFATAARAGALLELTWDRVDLERGLIDLHDPARRITNKRRAMVPLSEGVLTDLRAAKQEAMSKHVIEWGGKNVASVKKGIAAAGARAGCPWVTPHVFRHSAARFMAEDGIPMAEIAQFLGHDNERTTFKVYARFSPTHLRQAARSVDFGGRHRD